MTNVRRLFSFRFIVAFLAIVAVLPTTARAEPAEAQAKPKLLVLVVFDQLRGDYLERWNDLFGKDGFRRLETEGAWFSNCHYPYSVTKTAAGHASLATGCSPCKHGIIANEWFDRRAEEATYCVCSSRYTQVPPAKVKPKEKEDDGKKASDGVSPETLRAPTLGDALKKATNGKSRVVSLSFKDRSAVLLGGARADACYWFDTTTGSFITSTYYRDRLHSWVESFNGDRPADAWYGKDWTPLNPKLDYKKLCKLAGRDDPEEELAFRRMLPSFTRTPGALYYKSLYATPFGNELLLQLAKQAVVAEKLGSRDVPDLLCISFSCNDPIGHLWGPDSPEVLDVTLRSDLVMKELLGFLDEKVGKGKYALALSADHGICPLVEVSKADGVAAERVPPALLGVDADDFLRTTFGKEGEKGRWVSGRTEPWVYLNRTLIEDRGLHCTDVERSLAKWLERQPGILKAYTRSQLLKGVPDDDAIGQAVLRSFYPDRSGDVVVILKPYHQWGSPLSAGTNHGTPHSYDTHVPLLAFGPGIRGGQHKERITPQAGVAILARAAGIAPPASAEAPVPASLK